MLAELARAGCTIYLGEDSLYLLSDRLAPPRLCPFERRRREARCLSIAVLLTTTS